MIRWIFLSLLIPAAALAQGVEIRSGGSRAAEPEVLALVKSYRHTSWLGRRSQIATESDDRWWRTATFTMISMGATSALMA